MAYGSYYRIDIKYQLYYSSKSLFLNYGNPSVILLRFFEPKEESFKTGFRAHIYYACLGAYYIIHLIGPTDH